MTEIWKERIESYKQSGQSVAGWCRDRGVSVSAFRYHLHRAKEKNAPRFIELPAPPEGLQLRIGGAVLELSPDFDERTLQRFLSVLVKTC